MRIIGVTSSLHLGTTLCCALLRLFAHRCFSAWALACFLAFGLATLSVSSYAQALRLDDAAPLVPAWPHATVLFDTQKNLTPEQAIAAFPRFESRDPRYASLGVRSDAVWVRIPVQTSAHTDGHWIAEIDYPPLQYIDAHLIDEGRIVRSAKFGSLRPFAARPLQSRSHAIEFDLAPSKSYDVLFRFETGGSLVLPITFEKPATFHGTALAEQTLQGLLLGIGLSLLFYSLSQWWGSREALFLKYAALVTGSILFILLQLGLGTQYLWRDNNWLQYRMSGLAALLAICGTFLFLEEALRDTQSGSLTTGRARPIWRRIMWGGAALTALLALLYALGVFNTAVVTIIVTILGPMPSLLCMPQFIERARKRDAIGIYLLIAWTIYMVGVLVITAVIRGQLPVNFWTLHSFQFSATFDMLAWMYVLALRSKASRKAIEHASLERDVMRALAHTDPLTGLANRRSLNDALAIALKRSSNENLLAVYVIDVDEFKPVNDTYGHDTGDELLIAIAQLLKSHVRTGDVVARFGGDEFVVLAHSLRRERQAAELGDSLLSLFNRPIQLKTCTVSVGLTIGFAIAPHDGADATTLLKRADDAMYSGKQSGKRRVRRAGT
jgi:diguanylate cyclase